MKKVSQIQMDLGGRYVYIECDDIPALVNFYARNGFIVIMGFNNRQTSKFNHENIRDYVLWFTKVGAVESEFDITINKDFKLMLKGVDWTSEPEQIIFGHVFPQNSKSADKLFDEFLETAPDYY